MNEQKRKILNIILIVINVVLVVAIARVAILLHNCFSPKGYQKIICRYTDSTSLNDYFCFINDYKSYESIINMYNAISKEAKELQGNNEYVTGNYLKFSEDFFNENQLLVIHSFGYQSINRYRGITSYKELPKSVKLKITVDKESKMGDNIEHIYIIPMPKNVNSVKIQYPCTSFTRTIVGNGIPIGIIVFFDVVIIGYVITRKKVFISLLIKFLLLALFIVIIGCICYYLYVQANPSISEKPIIYLYPKEDTQVSVKLGNEDRITCSYPTYTSDGWNVLAKPTGDLIDLNSGRNLYSLYYECDNSAQYTMKNDGFVVESEKLVEFLEEKLSILGLTEREAEEFIVYWLPRLQANKYNYIRFATMDEINQNMPLEFSTNPDTLIRVLMTYKPLEHPIDVEEQQLSTPERIGFVAVEWGGAQIK